MKTREIVRRYFKSLVEADVISLDDYGELVYGLDGVELSDDCESNEEE